MISTVSSNMMQPFPALITMATVLALTATLTGARGVITTDQSVTHLLQALVQDKTSAKILQQAMVETIDATAQRFSLNMVGCDSISTTVRSSLSDYLEEVFPGRSITISCAAGVISGGVTYTRWGHDACPSVPGTQLLYTGRVAGAFFNQKGGGANYLCLPNDPQYNLKTNLPTHYSSIYGTEYQYPLVGTHDHDVPCAVCYATTRAAKLMIPAKTSCPPNWTREYYGYIMSEGSHWSDRSRNQYICVDKNQVSLPGSHANINGNVLYHVRAVCHGIQCPPYSSSRVLTCAVCTN